MSADDDLIEILKEALAPRGTVTARRMFGGRGIYFDGLFFALIDDGVIYVRVTEATRPRFETEGSVSSFLLHDEERAGRASFLLALARAASR